MRNQHVTHLITRYIHGQLRPSQRARVVNHVRICAACRSALAREEWIASDLRRGLPVMGAVGTRGGHLAQVWAGVWHDVSGPRARERVAAWMPGVAALLVVVLLLSVALPLLSESGVRAEAAPHQAYPLSTASPTPAASETHEAHPVSPGVNLPRATVAYAAEVGATPAPMPEATVSPEARTGSIR